MKNTDTVEQNKNLTWENAKPGDLFTVVVNYLCGFEIGETVILIEKETTSIYKFKRTGDHYVQLLAQSEVEPFEDKEESSYFIFPKTNNPTAYAKRCYEISKSLGEDGSRVKREDMYMLDGGFNTLKGDFSYRREGISKDKEELLAKYGAESVSNREVQFRTILAALTQNKPPNFSDVAKFIVESSPKALDFKYDLNVLIPFVKLVGSKVRFDIENRGISTGTGSNKKQLTIKAFGRKFGFNKWETWPIIAEKIKQHVNRDVEIKFFTDYENLRKYYTDEQCSGGSCMRHAYDNLAFHPCAVYAHDIETLTPRGRVVFLGKNVSPGIKLAVLFENGEPIARAMVNTDSKTRGKAFGSGASTLTKMLDFSDSGIDGHVNIIQTDGGHIMPYIDGSSEVDEETGEIGYGELDCNYQSGIVNFTGVWSEYEDCTIPEGEEVWSDVLDSCIHEDNSIALYEGGYTHVNDSNVHFSEAEDSHFIDTDGWVVFNGEWYLYDNMEDMLLEYIQDNANIQELLDFAEDL